MLSELATKTCMPCQGGIPPLRGAELRQYQEKLGGHWKVINSHHLEKEYQFKNFRDALDFTINVGEMAEVQGHHPDILTAWARVEVKIWTHKIDGLSEGDFILAAKIDEIAEAPDTKVL